MPAKKKADNGNDQPETPDNQEDYDSKPNSTDSEEAKEARQAAHDKISKKTDDNKAQHEEIDKAHRLIDEAPVVRPHQNPPPGFPRIEVPAP